MAGRESQRRIADFLDDRVARIDQIITARRQQAVLMADVTRRQIMDRLLQPNLEQISADPWFLTDGTRQLVRLASRWTGH